MLKKPLLSFQFLKLAFKPAPKKIQPPTSQLSVLLQQSLPVTREGWYAYWLAQGQPWRTEPEIESKRQEYLVKRRAIIPDIEKSIYPFRGVKLNRADVEWLLATHEKGRGPVNWNEWHQTNRERLDLRGADLSHINLSRLPLTCLLGGLITTGRAATQEQREKAAIVLKDTNLRETHLEGAILRSAHLENATLHEAYLQGANFRATHFEGANLYRSQLQDTYLRDAHLQGADLRGSFLDTASNLTNITLSDEQFGPPLLADIHWGDVNLAVVGWSQIKILGDESIARQNKHDGKMKKRKKRLEEYENAARANRQLSVTLQAQGLIEAAARFAYRAQLLQRWSLWHQMLQPHIKLRQRIQALGSWLFSCFLFLVAGYGYRLGRSFLAYLLIIGLFMLVYRWLDPHLLWNEAFVVSMTAFHGRGFSPSTFTPGDPVSFASTAEAFVGLIIEVTFIATLTQRFFNR